MNASCLTHFMPHPGTITFPPRVCCSPLMECTLTLLLGHLQHMTETSVCPLWPNPNSPVQPETPMQHRISLTQALCCHHKVPAPRAFATPEPAHLPQTRRFALTHCSTGLTFDAQMPLSQRNLELQRHMLTEEGFFSKRRS